MGIYVWGTGCGLDGVDSSQAYAELNPDGTVTMYTCWEDHGQGADMGTLQSAHETLRHAGIRPDQIKLVMNDTKLAPNSGPAGGSRSQVMSGNACRLAAENLLAAMRKEDGSYRTYEEMKAEGIETKVLGNWVTDYCATHPVDQATSQGEPFATYMYTLFLPEVCVDTQTGKVKVEKSTCVADVGTILNKLLVDGNFYGGPAQGIGLALTEDFEDLSKHTSLKNCGIPYPKEIPDDIELHYLETYRPNGPYGAAGCGEAPLDAPHPAILNAIYNATQDSIRRIAEVLGCAVAPTDYEGDKSPCCGYGGLTQYTNREVAKKMTDSCLDRSQLPYLSYCMACRDRFARAGRESMHILELVYGTSVDHCPDISAKRYNRLSLKQALQKEVWNEEVEADMPGFTIDYTPEAIEMMDDRMILKSDVTRVLQSLRETGEAILDEETGLIVTRARLGNVTFWVKLTETETGYLVHRAYSHRMTIQNR